MSQPQNLAQRSSQKVAPKRAQKSSQTLVSILINNYNYGRFLADAIDSALGQTYQPCEVIVVDDGSTDSSHEVIKAYGTQIVPVQKPNGGQASAFNAGFQASQGDIICFLDSDDTFAAEKAAQIVDVLTQNTEASWCFHPVERVDEQLKPWSEPTESYQGASGVYDLRDRMHKGKFGKYFPFECLVTSGMCFERSLLKQILPMPTDIKITSDDYIKYAALGTSKGYALLKELAAQRIHGSNAYTYSNAKPLIESKILIQTAYYLRQDFPVIKAYANNLFALGLVRGAEEPAAETEQGPAGEPAEKHKKQMSIAQMIDDYQQGLSITERVQVKSKQYYYRYIKPSISKYLDREYLNRESVKR